MVKNKKHRGASTSNSRSGRCPFAKSTFTSSSTATAATATDNPHASQITSDKTKDHSSIISNENDGTTNSVNLMSSSSSLITNTQEQQDQNNIQANQDKPCTCHDKKSNDRTLNPRNERKRRAYEMSSPGTSFNSLQSSPSSSLSQPETPLTFLCLSKSWLAATNRVISHPHEAQYGCTSSARSLLPLSNNNKSDNDTDSGSATNSLTTNAMASSPLALVTRYGAPSYCIESVLNAEKRMVRRCIPNRGTPLHEAIMLYPTATTTPLGANVSLRCSNDSRSETCDNSNDQLLEYLKIVRMLLKADEELDTIDEEHKSRRDEKRATLMQDVDGNVPLHLLIRQGFYHYLGEIASSEQDHDQATCNNEQTEHPIFTIAKELIASSPEAVSIPDCTEFEVTPLILVLKSSVYANEQHQQRQLRNPGRSTGIDYFNSTIERKIFDVCKIMLQYSPASASLVMVGYTAVHSAVFHGRCCDTLRLLLNADEVNRYRIYSSTNKIMLPAAMQANKFGELPLHFAAMRGECTRSISLISLAAPWASLRRDTKVGLTPIHWLWVRFMDCMLHRFGKLSFCDDEDDDYQDETENEEENTQIFSLAKRSSLASASSYLPNSYNDNGHICFDLEYHIRTEAIDPPVDYTEMRHIVPEHSTLEDTLTRRVIRVLRRVRERHRQLIAKILRGNQREQTEKEKNIGNKTMTSPLNHNVKQECPFSKSVLQPNNIASENDAPITNAKCPYAHLAVMTQKNNKCPYSKVSNREIPDSILNVELQMKMITDASDSSKKCPFRCPFVFDSYPLGEELLGSDQNEAVREEQVISLFWAKVTSLLHAAALAKILDINRIPGCLSPLEEVDYGRMHMLHTACSSPCPFSVVRLCLELHPEQVIEKDSSGKLPLHHAALRLLDAREFMLQGNDGQEKQGNHAEESDSVYDALNFGSNRSLVVSKDIAVTEGETAKVVELILSSSPEAAFTFDSNNRLPLHYCIDSTVKSIVESDRKIDFHQNEKLKNWNASTFDNVMKPLKSLIDIYPEALECMDAQTNLFPFMQASAMATEISPCDKIERKCDNINLSLVYSLILEKPSIIELLKKKY